MELLAGWTGLILGFSGLIFIHELGHFLLAKWNGVKVHVFSIGMGPYLVSFTHNGTVYALSLIPMGGYVKMLGQDDLNADLSANKNPADFRNKRPGQKAAILAAGAGFNIILTILLFTSVYWAGLPVEPPVIGHIPPDKAVARAVMDNDRTTPANLKRGDRIERVNDIPVKSFFDMMMQITACPIGEPIVLAVQRKEGGRGLEYVRVEMEDDKKNGIPNIGLGAGTVLKEEELLPLGFASELGVYLRTDPSEKEETKNAPAGKSGLFKKGDRIISIDDRTNPQHPISVKMDSEYALFDVAAASRNADPKILTGAPRIFVIERNSERIEIPLASEFDPKEGASRFGIAPSIVKRVTQIDENSPAYKAEPGLRKGDYVLGFDADNSAVHPWKSGTLAWIKSPDDEKILKAKIVVPEVAAKDPKEIFHQNYVVEETFQKPGLVDAMATAWDDTRHYTSCMFATLRNLVTGGVSPKNLSGPLGIGHNIFDVASKQSFRKYIWFLGFISLNLGVMQLLPIPLLDGFHLVMVLAEKVKGSSVNAKIQEAFMYAGLAMIGSLLMYVMWNDVTRFFPGH